MLTKDLFIFNLFRLILLITLSDNYITRLLFIHKKKNVRLGKIKKKNLKIKNDYYLAYILEY